MRHSIVVVLLLACACVDEPAENPSVASAATSTAAACEPNERLVTDVCTQLGPDDGCVDVDDVCVSLCDELATCTTTGGLRAISAWPTAPRGYCVECTVP